MKIVIEALKEHIEPIYLFEKTYYSYLFLSLKGIIKTPNIHIMNEKPTTLSNGYEFRIPTLSERIEQHKDEIKALQHFQGLDGCPQIYDSFTLSLNSAYLRRTRSLKDQARLKKLPVLVRQFFPQTDEKLNLNHIEHLMRTIHEEQFCGLDFHEGNFTHYTNKTVMIDWGGVYRPCKSLFQSKCDVDRKNFEEFANEYTTQRKTE